MSSSRSIDLVQDAASDCSVVASLCAGVARAERGHDQVRSLVKSQAYCANYSTADASGQTLPVRQASR